MTTDELLLIERREDIVILEVPCEICRLAIILWSCEGPALCMVIDGGGELAILYISSASWALAIAGFRADAALPRRVDGLLETSWGVTRSRVILA